MTASRVASVEAIPLVTAREPADLDASSETVLVRVVDEDGRAGVGESDAPARAVRELVEMDDLFEWSRGLRSIVVGMDPFELVANHARMLRETQYHGRRGLGVHAVSAVDMALYDLAGKQLGRPAYQLLGGACRSAIRPYATIWPGSPNGRTLGEMMDRIGALFERALALGFRAVKMEVVFRDLVDDRGLGQCIREGRRLLGPDIAMLVDFGYRWTHWRDAARVLTRLEDCDLYLAEATLQHDDLDGHAKLARVTPMRIAGAEFAATVQECREWLERGQVDVLQPDVNRCGGLTELRRIAELATHHGAEVVPHGWKTGITVAAQRHFQAATPCCPMIETFHPELFESTLRSSLTGPEAVVVDGFLPLPDQPGLGVAVDEMIVDRYRLPRRRNDE
jgi:L-rhamnonate dehydratase